MPLVTPLTATGAVCEDDVAALIRTIAPHVDAVLAALSTGEGWALDAEQWLDMVRYTVRHAAGLPVVAGVLRATTAEVIERAAIAAAEGVQAIAVSTPFGVEVSQDGMYEHFATLDAVTSVPIVVYNETAVSGNKAELATLLRICALPTVVAIKDSSADQETTRALTSAAGEVAVWQGWEPLLVDGGPVDGFAIGLANIEPSLCAELFGSLSTDAEERVRQACEDNGLLEDDWFRRIKFRLHAEGTLSTPHTVR